MAHNYIEEMKNDIQDYIMENDINVLDDDFDSGELYDQLFVGDSVTGNGSGSYTFNTYRAEENIAHNWDIIGEMLEDGFIETESILNGAEYIDVCIRCYLLLQAFNEVIEEIEKGGK